MYRGDFRYAPTSAPMHPQQMNQNGYRNEKGRAGDIVSPTSPFGRPVVEQSISRGKPVRPLACVSPHAEHHSGGFSPNVQSRPAAHMSPTNAPATTIRCCDPYNQKVYEVPFQYVEETQGKHTFATNPSGRRAQVCMKFQDGQCNMKTRCQQIHAERAWVQDMRSRFYEQRKEYVSDIMAFDPHTRETLAFKYSEVDSCSAKDNYRALPYDQRNGFAVCRDYSQSGTCPAGRACPDLHILPEKYHRCVQTHNERRTHKAEHEREGAAANSSGSNSSGNSTGAGHSGPSTPLTPGFSPSVVPSPVAKPFSSEQEFEDKTREHAQPPTTYGAAHNNGPVAPVVTRSGYGPQYSNMRHSVSDSSLGYEEKYPRHYSGRGSSPHALTDSDSYSMGSSYGMDDGYDRYGKGSGYYRNNNRGNNTPPELRQPLHPMHPREDGYRMHPHPMEVPSPHYDHIDSPVYPPHDIDRSYSSDMMSTGYEHMQEGMPHMHQEMSSHGPPCIDMTTGEYIMPEYLEMQQTSTPNYQNSPYEAPMDCQEKYNISAPKGPSKALLITKPPLREAVEVQNNSSDELEDDIADSHSTPNSRSHSAPPVNRTADEEQQSDNNRTPHSSFDLQCANNSIGSSKLGKIGLEGINEASIKLATKDAINVSDAVDKIRGRTPTVRAAAYRSRSK